jgi:hypothetical protein
MTYAIDADIPHDFEEYQLKPQQAQVEIPYSICFLSDIEMAYAFTCIKVSGYLPCFEILKQAGTYYKYEPDKRTYTIREIGKPSSGPSPPLPLIRRYNGEPETVQPFFKNHFFFNNKKNKTT